MLLLLSLLVSFAYGNSTGQAPELISDCFFSDACCWKKFAQSVQQWQELLNMVDTHYRITSPYRFESGGAQLIEARRAAQFNCLDLARSRAGDQLRYETTIDSVTVFEMICPATLQLFPVLIVQWSKLLPSSEDIHSSSAEILMPIVKKAICRLINADEERKMLGDDQDALQLFSMDNSPTTITLTDQQLAIKYNSRLTTWMQNRGRAPPSNVQHRQLSKLEAAVKRISQQLQHPIYCADFSH